MKTYYLLLCMFISNSFMMQATNKGIYLQLYSLRTDISNDLKGTLDKVSEMGYNGIEAANYSDGKFYDLSPAEFKSEIENRKMTVLSSHVGKNLNNDINKTNWEEIWNWWDQTIQAHKAAGMKYIVVPSMPQVKTLSDLKIYCDYYNKIGEKCNNAGLRFGYHNHSFEFVKIEGETMYDYMLKNTDRSKVFFQMDVYWVVRGGKSPVEYFNKYPGRFELLHLKDDKELGQSGMVGFDAILRNIDKSGCEYLIVEVENYSEQPFKSVSESILYLKSLLKIK